MVQEYHVLRIVVVQNVKILNTIQKEELIVLQEIKSL